MTSALKNIAYIVIRHGRNSLLPHFKKRKIIFSTMTSQRHIRASVRLQKLRGSRHSPRRYLRTRLAYSAFVVLAKISKKLLSTRHVNLLILLKYQGENKDFFFARSQAPAWERDMLEAGAFKGRDGYPS